MTKPLNAKQIEALRKIDTPTICNLLEMVVPSRRGTGFTTKFLHCAFPNLPPIVGYARTATIRAKEPGPLAGHGPSRRLRQRGPRRHGGARRGIGPRGHGGGILEAA